MRRESPAGACYPLIKKGHPIGKPPVFWKRPVTFRGMTGPCPGRVKLRRTRCEQMSSWLPLKADIAQCSRHVSKVPATDLGAAMRSSARCMPFLAEYVHICAGRVFNGVVI
jgi:hypothetical protein